GSTSVGLSRLAAPPRRCALAQGTRCTSASSSPPRQRASRSDERQQPKTAPCTASRLSRSLGPLLKTKLVIHPRRALKRVARPATSYGRLWNGAWPRVGLHRLPVLDEPIDGPGFRRCMHTDVGHSAAPKPRLRVELLKLRHSAL